MIILPETCKECQYGKAYAIECIQCMYKLDMTKINLPVRAAPADLFGQVKRPDWCPWLAEIQAEKRATKSGKLKFPYLPSKFKK